MHISPILYTKDGDSILFTLGSLGPSTVPGIEWKFKKYLLYIH